jgi:hypothetical protein
MDKDSIMIKISKKNNKTILKISKREWKAIGKKAGWGEKALQRLDEFNKSELLNVVKDFGPDTDIFSIQTPWVDNKSHHNKQVNRNPNIPNNPSTPEESIYNETLKDSKHPIATGEEITIFDTGKTGKIKTINSDKTYTIDVGGSEITLSRNEFKRHTVR